MSINPVNRFPSGLMGIIVAGGDKRPDPRKLGRVKVYYPIFGEVRWEDLPWVSTGSTPNDSGQHSFDRPPQEGSAVMGSNITDSGHSLVRSLINGAYKAGSDLVGNNPIINEARNLRPEQASGPPKNTQTRETNRSGVEKVTAPDTPSDTPAKTIAERDGTFTPGTSQLFDIPHMPLKNITTALTKAMETMGMDNIPIPKLPDLSKIPTAGLPKEVGAALGAISGLIGSFTPQSGTNFTIGGGVAGDIPDSFYADAANTLLGNVSVDNLHTLEDTLLGIINTGIENTLANNIISLVSEVEGPFGNVIVSVSANGNVYVESSNTINAAIEAFESLVGGIPSADTGTSFLTKEDGSVSDIVKELIGRMPVPVQKGLKEAVENKGKGVQKILNDAARTFLTGS